MLSSHCHNHCLFADSAIATGIAIVVVIGVVIGIAIVLLLLVGIRAITASLFVIAMAAMCLPLFTYYS